MLAVFCFAARRDAHAVANGQGELSWPVCLEPPGQLGRRLDFLADDQPRSLVVAWGILVELEQVARIILGRVRFLRIRQVRAGTHALTMRCSPSLPCAFSPARMASVIRSASACVGDTTRADLYSPPRFF